MGNLVAEGSYDDGQRHGEWTFFESNQPVRQVRYNRGAVVDPEDAAKK